MSAAADAPTGALPGAAVGAAFLGVAALSASAAPLVVYALSLGAFGLVHVLAELRYVDERFRPRLPQGALAWMLALLGVIVAYRLALLAGLGPHGSVRAQVELALVVLLALGAASILRGSGPGPALLAGGVAASVAAGALWAPLTTLIVLAVLHNLTPVGFLAERLRGPARRTTLLLCGIAFVGVPAVIASGGPRVLLEQLGVAFSRSPLWGVGSLEEHIGVFVPAALRGGVHAVDVFAAAVYLQVLHYAVVLHVLPRLGAGAAGAGGTAWPDTRPFARALCAAGAVSLLAFALAFGEARQVYGVFAAFHAWLEVPILLLALGGPALLRLRVA